MKKIKSVDDIRIVDEKTAQPKLEIEQWDGSVGVVKLNQEELAELQEDMRISEVKDDD